MYYVWEAARELDKFGGACGLVAALLYSRLFKVGVECHRKMQTIEKIR